MSNLNDLLEIMKSHQAADRLIQGQWWQDGQGCFYGCAMESDDNPIERACEKFGMPLWLGYWSEGVFEKLPKDEALLFPVQLLEKLIAYNGDLEILKHTLAIKRLTHLSEQNEGDVKSAIDGVISCHYQAVDGDSDIAWSSAKSAVESAVESAESAARSAARSAAEAAARSAESAAEAAARSAESAAWSATGSAAWSTAWSAAWSAESAARSAAYQQERDWMYELLKEGCK